MAIHRKLTIIGGDSAGVTLPKEQLLDEGLIEVAGDGEISEIEDVQLRVTYFDRGGWQIVLSDRYDFPSFLEKRAYEESPRPTA
jgi:hypothetical protein